MLWEICISDAMEKILACMINTSNNKVDKKREIRWEWKYIIWRILLITWNIVYMLYRWKLVVWFLNQIWGFISFADPKQIIFKIEFKRMNSLIFYHLNGWIPDKSNLKSKKVKHNAWPTQKNEVKPDAHNIYCKPWFHQHVPQLTW